jgi:hypothetical protein
MPRSNSETSPRTGGILFLVKEGRQRSARFANLLVRQFAGIERKLTRPAQDLHKEGLLVSHSARLRNPVTPESLNRKVGQPRRNELVRNEFTAIVEQDPPCATGARQRVRVGPACSRRAELYGATH